LDAARRNLFGGSDASRDAVSFDEMNDDHPAGMLEALKAEHRNLDERIQMLSSEPMGDQLELARLKRRKLMLKDQIQMIIDSNVPDIIA
jgi:hypothetical protein